MSKELREGIKSLCGDKIQVTFIIDNEINFRLPYDNAIFNHTIEGNTIDEQIDNFIEDVNARLEDMRGHLEECKLSIDIN